jgi:radical SAM protein with 4Fe4S-binding SPASM domain
MERFPIPLEIIIEITGKCRLVCPYCTGPRSADVPLKDIKATLDEAADLGVKAVRITGGEPLIHPDIQTILTYAKAKKFAVLLNTAAEGISPKLMKTIISTVDVALVSLQGHNEKSNTAYTRSRLPFVDKIKNIFLLKAYLPTLWLATVITPTMAGSVKKFVPLVKKINPAAWTLLRPISDMNDDLKQMDLNFYRELVGELMEIRRKEQINAFIANPIPMCITGDLKTGKEIFFGANFDDGHVRIVRSAQGYFKPSYFLETNLGSTIKEAWNHPFLRELNSEDFLPDLCRRCPVLDTCRGGCRSMALRAAGTALAQDPLFDPVIAQQALSNVHPAHPRR